MRPLLILFTLLIAPTVLAQPSHIEIAAIKVSLKKELSDTLTAKLHAEEEVQAMIDLLDRHLIGEGLFPYRSFDHVSYAIYEDYAALSPEEQKDRRPLKVVRRRVIDKEQLKQLLLLFNDPRNFQWGECGTFMPEARIEFDWEGQTIAWIALGCGRAQTKCFPKHPLTRWGLLNDAGLRKLDAIGL